MWCVKKKTNGQTFQRRWAALGAGENRSRCTLDGRDDVRHTWSSDSVSRSSAFFNIKKEKTINIRNTPQIQQGHIRSKENKGHTEARRRRRKGLQQVKVGADGDSVCVCIYGDKSIRLTCQTLHTSFFLFSLFVKLMTRKTQVQLLKNMKGKKELKLTGSWCDTSY